MTPEMEGDSFIIQGSVSGGMGGYGGAGANGLNGTKGGAGGNGGRGGESRNYAENSLTQSQIDEPTRLYVLFWAVYCAKTQIMNNLGEIGI
ncbi:hypothetical protein U9L35_23655, partial [Salmonella enterica subsp. enterica serovar Minnesota]|nr:hypothetical protein [Salmonella enterica subsp. enterica serovar Minnesota]